MKGDFSTPIKQTRHDEIGTLQSRFNTMRQNLGQVDQMRQHFVQMYLMKLKHRLHIYNDCLHNLN